MPSPAEFKQLIIGKYPSGVSSDGRKYVDIPDTELTNMIVNKFPTGVTSAGVPYKNYLSNTSVEGAPVEKLSPEQEEATQPGGVKGFFRGLIAPAVITAARGPQAIQSIITGETPEYMIPTGFGKVRVQDPYKEAGGDKTKAVRQAVGRAAQTVALGTGSPAASGALFGGGSALEEGKGLKETAVRSAVGAGVGKLTSVGTKKLQKPAEYLMDKALRVSDKVIQKGRSPAKVLLEKGVVGTKKQITKQVQGIANKAKGEIDKALSSRTDKVSINRALDGVIESYKKKGVNLSREEVIKRVSTFARTGSDLIKNPKLLIEKANQLRSNLDKVVAETHLADKPTTQFNKELTRNVVNKLRSTVQKVAPETKQPFKEQSAAITALKSLDKKGKSFLIDLLTTGAGAGIGAPFGKSEEFGGAIAAFNALKRGTLPKTVAAQVLSKASKSKAVNRALSLLMGRTAGRAGLRKE